MRIFGVAPGLSQGLLCWSLLVCQLQNYFVGHTERRRQWRCISGVMRPYLDCHWTTWTVTEVFCRLMDCHSDSERRRQWGCILGVSQLHLDSSADVMYWLLDCWLQSWKLIAHPPIPSLCWWHVSTYHTRKWFSFSLDQLDTCIQEVILYTSIDFSFKSTSYKHFSNMENSGSFLHT